MPERSDRGVLLGSPVVGSRRALGQTTSHAAPGCYRTVSIRSRSDARGHSGLPCPAIDRLDRDGWLAAMADDLADVLPCPGLL
jgi:hypothetical protein